MAQLRELSFCATLVVLSALACQLLQAPIVTPTPSSTPTLTLAATDTLVPIPSPTTIATQTASLPGQPAPFRRVTSLAGPLPDSYTDMQVYPLADGSVWIITSQAAMRWDGQKWEEVLSGSEDVLASVDDSGRLWVVPQDGREITAWQGGQWATYGADSGWAGEYTPGTSGWAPASWSVQSGAVGTVWLPTGRDVRVFDGNRWSLYTLEDMGFPPPEGDDMEIVHHLVMGESGSEPWVGECYYSGPGPMGGQGVRWLDGKTWRGEEAPVGPTCVSTLEVDPAGNVWLGAYNDVWRYEHAGQTWTQYSLPEALLGDYNFAHPRQLMVDRAGDVWVMMQMCGGASCDVAARLYRIHNGEWSLIIDSSEGITPSKQLALDGNGQGWLFWDDMAYRLEGESMEPVASIAARSVGVSPDGRVWVVAEDEGEASLWILEP